jgi:hypothetical protein
MTTAATLTEDDVTKFAHVVHEDMAMMADFGVVQERQMELRERFEAFLTVLPEELTFGEEEPGSVLDRYYAPGFEYHNDGIVLDRQRMIDHVRPVRRNVVSWSVELGDMLVGDDRVAARYTIRAVMRKGKELTTEVYMFALFAPDGRIRRVDSITRLGEKSGTDRP